MKTAGLRSGSKSSPSRRAFLRGSGGVAIALPFLESLSERAPQAATAKPVFGLFLCAVEGVVGSSFFPDTTGPLTQAGLAAASKATSALAGHADDLLFLSGINWPTSTLGNDAHAEGLCMALTGRKAVVTTTGTTGILASGPSADAYIAAHTHPDQGPVALYAGQVNSFDGPRLTYLAPQKLAPVISNPYELYAQLVGFVGPDGMTPATRATAQQLLQSRKSVHDLVQGELTSLMQHPRLGSADRQKLQLHFDSIRDAEKMMAGMGSDMAAQCSTFGLDVTALQALQMYRYDAHRTDEMVRLFMSLVAMAFACNFRRAASLQWGDPYDGTLYDVPSNPDSWKFSYISHRLMSDSAIGTDQSNPMAAQAHAEIDRVRMTTLAAGLDHFKARGLADQAFVMWTVNYAEGPSHAFKDVPHIIWGNGGGFLKQGQYLSAGGVTNDRLLNTLISAALQDSQTTVTDFGGSATGMLDAIRA
jgi:hypothetical protein